METLFFTPDEIPGGPSNGWLPSQHGRAFIAQCAIADDVGQLLEAIKAIDFDHVVIVIREEQDSIDAARDLADIFGGKLTVLYGAEFNRLGIVAIVGDGVLLQFDDDRITPELVSLLDDYVTTGRISVPMAA
jgi:hypothetical protein